MSSLELAISHVMVKRRWTTLEVSLKVLPQPETISRMDKDLYNACHGNSIWSFVFQQLFEFFDSIMAWFDLRRSTVKSAALNLHWHAMISFDIGKSESWGGVITKMKKFSEKNSGSPSQITSCKNSNRVEALKPKRSSSPKSIFEIYNTHIITYHISMSTDARISSH